MELNYFRDKLLDFLNCRERMGFEIIRGKPPYRTLWAAAPEYHKQEQLVRYTFLRLTKELWNCFGFLKDYYVGSMGYIIVI